MTSSTGVVVLAAGASRRLGRPKQLEHFRDRTLLEHALELTQGREFASRVLILGARSEQIRNALPADLEFTIVDNPTWEEGIASSIRLGLQESLARNPSIDRLLYLLCDQPLLGGADIDRLLSHPIKPGLMAIYALYAGQPGAPAVFSREAFPLIETLKGDQGARKLTYLEGFNYDTVPLQAGVFDVDTEMDVQELKARERGLVRISVKLYGRLAERAGQDEIILEVKDGAAAEEIKQAWAARYDGTDTDSIRVAVNHKLDGGAPLREGDEVALLPPFAGG